MKCSICGFPLSPSHTNCPKCGASYASAGEQTVQGASTPQGSVPPLFMGMGQQEHHADGAYVDIATPQVAWNSQPPTWNMSSQPQSSQTTPSTFQTGENGAYNYYNQANMYEQGGQYGQYGQYSHVAEQQQGQLYAPQAATAEPSLASYNVLPQTPYASLHDGRRPHSPRLGFTIAGLCLICGALILVFVYFLATGLNASSSQAALTSTKPTSVPTAQPSPTAAISPTPTFPGQQYVSNAQMASKVDTATAQPITLATTFKAGERIYVTFNVHTPNNGAGGVCLLWYLNGQMLPGSAFAFPVSSSTSAYSYSAINTAGSGTVEVYWTASAQPSCSDPNKVLGTRLQFTVTP